VIIDTFVQMGPSLANYTDILQPLYDASSADKLIGLLDRFQIDVAMIHAPRWVGGTVFDPTYEKANQAIADAVKKFPKRLIGYGRVNPNWGEAAQAEARDCLTKHGMRGLMLDPDWENFNPADKSLVYPLMKLARQHKVPVKFHCGYYPAQPALFWDVATDFPEVPVILAHMGERVVVDALLLAERVSNIYLETSNHMYALRSCVNTLGAHRLLFGSNMPFSVPDAEMLKITHRTNISEEDKALILGGSAARLHNLEKKH
jgi:predicted TIM-barrel fold metal-dependent hydrolase